LKELKAGEADLREGNFFSCLVSEFLKIFPILERLFELIEELRLGCRRLNLKLKRNQINFQL
jgi:hypothetical protein